MEDHFKKIYSAKSALYEELVAHEDFSHNIERTILNIASIDSTTNGAALDCGCGTGRLSFMLAKMGYRVTAIDESAHMLDLARQKAVQQKLEIDFMLGQNQNLASIADGSMDLVTEGWSIGHVTSWIHSEEGNENEYLKEAAKIIQELERVTKPKGKIILFETLGTNEPEAKAPNPRLADLYSKVFEEQFQFKRETIRTDYRFKDIQQAKQLVNFFFGEEMAHSIQDLDVIEWTGVWWKQKK